MVHAWFCPTTRGSWIVPIAGSVGHLYGYCCIVAIQVEPPLVAFEDNDRDYLYWTSRTPHGYVVNCYRNPTSDYLMLHWADCYTINANQLPWTTGAFAKVCSPIVAALEDWARQVGGPRQKCEKCWA